ncbi:MAG TPA: MotA/TolQ/ExbB proton channel family protein [Planctomycetota bacterium]|jgi:biopolymer transport protein ExbB
MQTFRSINWKRAGLALGLVLAFTAIGAFAAEGHGGARGTPSFLDTAKDAGFMEYILLLVSIAGFALALQALVTLRAHLLRPPELAAELSNLVQEGNVEGAFDVAQGDNSLLGVMALATLSNAQYGKIAMEGALADTGEVEGNKLMNKVNTLNLIAAIAPMLGLTGTTVGMIETFATMSAGGAEITADKMAKGISIALICTFTGLMVAIPLLVLAFFLKARLVQVMLEVGNDCNEMIRLITSGEQPAAEA